VQVVSQVRDRDCVPELQLPHAAVSVCGVPGEQPVEPLHAPHWPQEGKVQVVSQVRLRDCVPELQLPHIAVSV